MEFIQVQNTFMVPDESLALLRHILQLYLETRVIYVKNTAESTVCIIFFKELINTEKISIFEIDIASEVSPCDVFNVKRIHKLSIKHNSSETCFRRQ